MITKILKSIKKSCKGNNLTDKYPELSWDNFKDDIETIANPKKITQKELDEAKEAYKKLKFTND